MYLVFSDKIELSLNICMIFPNVLYFIIYTCAIYLLLMYFAYVYDDRSNIIMQCCQFF